MHCGKKSFCALVGGVLALVLMIGLLPGRAAQAMVLLNTAPVAVDDSFVTNEDHLSSLADVLANDSDPDSDPLKIQNYAASDTQGQVSLIQNGDLDPYFGTDGKLTTTFSGERDFANAVAMQPDGKILIAGTRDNQSTDRSFAIARYNLDGSRDLSFGSSGVAIADFENIYARGRDLVVQPDGKILMAGEVAPDGYYDLALGRFNSDGSLDITFGNDGTILYDNASSAAAITLQPDGKLLVAGSSGYDFSVMRFNPDGSLDISFGDGGKVITDFGRNDVPQDILLQPDGKILVLGFLGGGGLDLILVRYNANGSLDSSFGDGGKVILDIMYYDLPYSFALQPDGKLLRLVLFHLCMGMIF